MSQNVEEVKRIYVTFGYISIGLTKQNLSFQIVYKTIPLIFSGLLGGMHPTSPPDPFLIVIFHDWCEEGFIKSSERQGQIELPLGPSAANHSGPLSINT